MRHAWQQGGDPLIGSKGAVRGTPAGAAAGRRAHCNLWSARAHRRHTYATVLPATIDGIRAHFGNPTQITLLRMPVSAEACTTKQCITAGLCASPRIGAASVPCGRVTFWLSRNGDSRTSSGRCRRAGGCGVAGGAVCWPGPLEARSAAALGPVQCLVPRSPLRAGFVRIRWCMAGRSSLRWFRPGTGGPGTIVCRWTGGRG